MDSLRVAFCDDDPVFRSLLREKVEAALDAPPVCFEASAAAELSAALDHRGFDLIFLDIDMPGLDGIRFGEQLRARGCQADIIYVSNMEDKVYEIFHVHPWSFLRKILLADELPAVIAEYLRSRRVPDDILVLPGGDGQTVSADPAELIYAEAVGKTQKLFFIGRDEPTLVRASMRDLEARLLPHGFLRIHKGFLVNYRFIRKITSRSVLLDTGGDLPVGRDRLAAARERYLSLMKWKGLTPPAGN